MTLAVITRSSSTCETNKSFCYFIIINYIFIHNCISFLGLSLKILWFLQAAICKKKGFLARKLWKYFPANKLAKSAGKRIFLHFPFPFLSFKRIPNLQRGIILKFGGASLNQQISLWFPIIRFHLTVHLIFRNGKLTLSSASHRVNTMSPSEFQHQWLTHFNAKSEWQKSTKLTWVDLLKQKSTPLTNFFGKTTLADKRFEPIRLPFP